MLICNAIALILFFAANVQSAPPHSFIDSSHIGERVFSYSGRKVDELLSKHNENSTQNPEEFGSYLEGDIRAPYQNEYPFRNGLIAYSARWPGAVVPYEIQGRFNEKELAIINHAFHEYHSKTCVRFKPRCNERDYIAITGDKTGCWSSMGRLGGRQAVNLQPSSCFRHYGTSMHELMHALGFTHEQNRPERDSYIRVLGQNVKPGMMVNFEKGSWKEQYGFGVPYDYASIMHYSKTSFSKNGQPTIEALKQTHDAQLMGQRNGFSKGDIAKLNAMYKCRTI